MGLDRICSWDSNPQGLEPTGGSPTPPAGTRLLQGLKPARTRTCSPQVGRLQPAAGTRTSKELQPAQDSNLQLGRELARTSTSTSPPSSQDSNLCKTPTCTRLQPAARTSTCSWDSNQRGLQLAATPTCNSLLLLFCSAYILGRVMADSKIR